jgi:hypothetical protein
MPMLIDFTLVIIAAFGSIWAEHNWLTTILTSIHTYHPAIVAIIPYLLHQMRHIIFKIVSDIRHLARKTCGACLLSDEVRHRYLSSGLLSSIKAEMFHWYDTIACLQLLTTVKLLGNKQWSDWNEDNVLVVWLLVQPIDFIMCYFSSTNVIVLYLVLYFHLIIKWTRRKEEAFALIDEFIDRVCAMCQWESVKAD